MTAPRERGGEHRQDAALLAYLDEKDATNFRTQGTPPAKTTGVTLTAAELLSGLIVGNPGSAQNYQLPTVTDLFTAWDARLSKIGGPNIDDAFEFSVVNTNGTGTVTLTTNTGWTLVPTTLLIDAVAAGNASSGRFRVRKTAAATATIYRVS